MPKFLVIRFSSIGDIVLTTPVVRCLKKQVSGAEVHFLTKKSFAPVIENNPYIDKKIYLADESSEGGNKRNSLASLIGELRNENYDYIIDLHHNLRTFLLKRVLMRSEASFRKHNFKKWMMVNFRINLLPCTHIVDRYFETVKKLGVKNDDEGLDYFLPEGIKLKVELPEKHVVFVIGAKHFTKQLPEEKIISVISKINCPVVLVGGKEDFEKGEEIEKKCQVPGTGKNIINLCGQLSINESALVIKNSEAVVTHDTGMMHIAAAFKKRIISVWGNTVPGFGMSPYYGNAEIQNAKFEIRNLSCRPCTKIGFTECPKGHFKCMMQQDTDEIAGATNRIIS